MCSLNRKALAASVALAALIAASGTGTGTGAEAQGGPPQHPAPGGVDMAVPNGILDPTFWPRENKALDLTSDEKTSIAELVTTFQSTAQPLVKKIVADEAAGKTLYETSPCDSDTATTTAQDEATAAGNSILAAQAVQADIYTTVLTSDQQAACMEAMGAGAARPHGLRLPARTARASTASLAPAGIRMELAWATRD